MVPVAMGPAPNRPQADGSCFGFIPSQPVAMPMTVDAMVVDGLITIERVEVIAYRGASAEDPSG